MAQIGREKLESNISKNIALFRKNAGMTQAGLAEQIGYSDKSVSKWERGEGIPDVICLRQMADLFGVTVDAFLEEEPLISGNVSAGTGEPAMKPVYGVNHLAIALISVSGVWLLAVLAVIIIRLVGGASILPFAIAFPVSMILAVIFNALWGSRKWAFLAISALVWSILFLICWICRGYNVWLLMVLGIPASVIVWLACRVKKTNGNPAE